MILKYSFSLHSPLCYFLRFEVLTRRVVAGGMHLHLGLLSKHHSGRGLATHFSCVLSHDILWLNPNVLLPVVIVHNLYLLCVNFVLIQPTGLRLDRRLRRAEHRFNAVACEVSLVNGSRWWYRESGMPVNQSVIV